MNIVEERFVNALKASLAAVGDWEMLSNSESHVWLRKGDVNIWFHGENAGLPQHTYFNIERNHVSILTLYRGTEAFDLFKSAFDDARYKLTIRAQEKFIAEIAGEDS